MTEPSPPPDAAALEALARRARLLAGRTGGSDPPPPPPPIMDGLDDLRAYLLRVHGDTVGTDDPILMLHTIHRVALEDYRRMLDAHEARLSDAVGDVAAAFAADTTAAIEAFKADTLSDAVAERVEAMREAAGLAAAARDRFRGLNRVLFCLTLLNWLAAALVLGLLAELYR